MLAGRLCKASDMTGHPVEAAGSRAPNGASVTVPDAKGGLVLWCSDHYCPWIGHGSGAESKNRVPDERTTPVWS
jgi:hypothetical protein